MPIITRATETTATEGVRPGANSRRDEILRAAGELFRRNGYHATSMRELARRLNVQGASLYSHIDSKEELLREIVDRAADAFITSARSVPRDAPPVKRLKLFVRGHLRVVEAEIETAAVFFHEWTHLSGEARAYVVERRDAYEAQLREIIAAGSAAGEFAVHDVRVATLLTLSTLNWSYQWLDPRGRLPLEELKAHYTDYILGALGAKKEA